jgi:serine phosphatase RsbU (regulator of sigma subunit)
MGSLKNLVIIPFLLLHLISAASHVQQIDSLQNKLTQVKDSLRIPILLNLCWEHRNYNPEMSVSYGLEAIEISTKYKDYEALAKAHSFVGVAYRILGNYSKSIDYYFNGLDLATRHGVKEQQGFAFINIANLHIYQEHYSKANENLNKALAIANEINSQSMLGYIYINYGRARQLVKDYDSALIFFSKALEIRMSINQIPEQAVCYKYIGDIYFEKDNMPLALENYKKSLSVIKKEVDKDLYANILIKIAQIDLSHNMLAESYSNAKKSYKKATEIGAKLIIRDASQILSEIYFARGNFKESANLLKQVIQYNDTLFGQQLSEKIFFVEYELDREIKEKEIDILNRDKTIKELKLNRVTSFNITLSIILILLAVLFIFTLISLQYRRSKNLLLEKQNSEINEQRISIEQKNRNLEEAYSIIEGYIGKITDSIRYAERIQEAILPPLSLSKPFFSDSFCFYKPKDFVSGDFYWLSVKNNRLFFAVADCTGHGVPGAFMSIIGMDLLNQAVSLEHIKEPKEILDFLNIELPRKLQREHDELILKDSMDIAVCSVDAENNTLNYCGALIPFMLIRNQNIVNIKSNYTSIGSSTKVFSKPFSQHCIDLQKGDWIYMYSDGFMDQIGGEKKKKYMRSHFQETLSTLSKFDGTVQVSELENIFIQWKGNNEQIDDVLVIGFKV